MSNSTPRERAVVLVVDDDPVILRSLRIILMREYEVHMCDSATKAVTQARDIKPDVIVLDVKMPEHDGFWVFAEVRKFNTHVPIIFNSAYQDIVHSGDVKQVFKPFGVLQKNGDLNHFLSMLERAIESTGAKTPPTP